LLAIANSYLCLNELVDASGSSMGLERNIAKRELGYLRI